MLDTNALYAYCMDFSARRRDGRLVRVQRRNRDEVVAEVDGAIETGSLKVLDIVAAELLNGAWKRRSGWRPNRPAPQPNPTLKL